MGPHSLVPVALTPAGTPRLAAYGLLAVIGLFGAVFTGRPELAALGAPFAVLLVIGLVLATAPSVSCRLAFDTDRVVEGDVARGELVLVGDTAAARLDVVVDLAPGWIDLARTAEGGDALAWSRPLQEGAQRLAFRLPCPRWGRVDLGPVWVRVHGPLGLVRWQGAATTRAAVRVLPSAERLRTLLDPVEPRAVAGIHLARRARGDGIEFADLRPYTPGDRLRSVNWRVSARRDGLWVNEHHPERAADLVLFVDSFADGPGDTSFALARAVRAAWTIARSHLDGHDRVGLVAFGGYPSWLPPGGGTRARYTLLDRMLATTPSWTEAPRHIDLIAPRAVPAGAFVVALTPLHDERVVVALAALRQRGIDVAAVRVEVDDLLTDDDAVLATALRLYRLEVAVRAATLDRAGVPVVEWRGGDDPAAVLAALAQVRRIAHVRGGRRR
jgi:uncharacterized protein (DUF58 family)